MSDRRFLAANDRVAHVNLRGQIDAPKFEPGEACRCLMQADLCRSPGGARDKQMLRGQPFQVLDTYDGWSFGMDVVDDYVGYLPEAAVGRAPSPSHRVGVRLAHVYSEPDIKSREIDILSFFSEVAVSGDEDQFYALEGGGFIAKPHLVPLRWRDDDFVSVGELFLGTPYLWGGNSGTGIDCSGLVQMALYAAARACPRDSDLQEAALGRALHVDDPLRRGDLIFWKGHVGMMSDADTLLHANAFHMAVAREPLQDAVSRIAKTEFGAITARKRFGE